MIRIDLDGLYTASELEGIFGRSKLAILRQIGGLRAAADLYLGKTVLEAFGRVHDNRRRQHASGRKEVDDGSASYVGKGVHGEDVQSVSRLGSSESLERQLEELEGSTLQETTV